MYPSLVDGRKLLKHALMSALGLTFVVTLGAAEVSAQPVPGGAVVPAPRPSLVPPVVGPNKRVPKRSLVPVSNGGDVVRREGGQPGVVDTGGGTKKTFDPNRADKADDKSAAGASAGGDDEMPAKVEDVIEWKSNFEQGIKCKKLPLDAKIRLDFNEISLGDLTKFISCVTEQNFILTGGANKNATVSILSPKPVTAYEAYKAYLSALEANGLSIVPNGRFLEIVPSGDVRTNGGPIYGVGRSGPNTDQMVTRLLQLDHVQAEEILPVLEKFKTKAADITVYAPTNTIILTDTGSNIRRMLKLIKDLDVPIGKERIWIRPVVNTAPAEIVGILEQLLDTKSSSKSSSKSKSRSKSRSKTRKSPSASASSVVGGGDVTSISVAKMIPDERTNSIIFVATRTAYLQVDRLIRKLDVAIPGEGAIHIHALENADADEISQTLTSLAGGGSRRSSRGTSGAAGGTSTRGSARSSKPTSGALFEGEVKITAYEPTNSLVIESSLKDYMNLRKVIRQLDVRRKQVYVEAIIMEVASNKDREIGFSGSGGATFDLDGQTVPLLFGVGGLGLDFAGAAETMSAGGGAIGLQGPLVDVSGGSNTDAGAGTFSIPAFGFTLKALQTTTTVNVLSTPHILTLENEEAEIQVGKRQPYSSSTFASAGGLNSLSGLLGSGGASNIGGLGGLGALGGLGSQVQYVDIDLTLKIKPQVNASNFVRLEIDQSIDDLDGFGVGGAPITSKRKVKNVVVVRDGQPVVIGGLIRDQESETVEKVPFLGDIPLLGLLFRRTKKTVEKKNLLMIIIPHVINDPSDLKRIYDDRREEYHEFARVLGERKKDFEGEMDYRKKTGIIHDMHVTLNQARRERELRERAIFEASDVDTVGPAETHDIEYDPRDAYKGRKGGK